jgi:hypothetical protein
MFGIMEKAKPETGNVRGFTLAAVKHTTFQVIRLLLQRKLLKMGMNCCTEPGLREALYIIYTHTFNNMQNINIMYILTTDLLLLTVTLPNDRPVFSSERAPHVDRIVTVKQVVIPGHEPHQDRQTE